MTTSKVKINTNPVANGYASAGERIVEYSSPNGGGLISFGDTDDGRLQVQLYRHDATVHITVGQAESVAGDVKPAPTVAVDISGDYPILVSIAAGPFFAREAEPDEGYEFPWIVLDERTGEHVATGTLTVAAEWVDRLNRTAR